MKKFRPDRRALTALRLITAAAGIFMFGVVRYYIPIDVVTYIIAAAIVTIVIFVDFIYLPVYFSSLRYETDGKTVVKHGGVIFRSHKSVRFETVQYTAAITSPFSKFTGLNFVILFVYGGQLRLEFLSIEDCEEILRLAGRFRKERV